LQNFCVDKTVLGAEAHLLVHSEGFSSISRVPPGTLLLTGRFRNSGSPCLDSLLRLGGSPVDVMPSEKWRLAMRTVGLESDVPWSQVMAPSQYKAHIKNILKKVIGSFDRLPVEYFNETWIPCGEVLDSLRPAKVDSSRFRALIEECGTGNGALESFRPGAGGYSPPVVYDRFGTRTGRLVVESGPNILTLKREHRGMIRSHFPDGKVVSLDFSSLEARIILHEADVHAPSADVYGHISKELFDGSIDRAAVKVAVLAELYGASKGLISRRLDMSGEQLDKFIDRIRSYFRTPDLRRRIAEDLSSTGFIHNKYGRPLTVDDSSSEHLFVNTYAQSTGVDVSLLGFKAILDRLGTDGIRPLFVLHDALILDVRNDRIKDVECVSSIEVPGYTAPFPLKVETLHEH
jgi:hypothetical protein